MYVYYNSSTLSLSMCFYSNVFYSNVFLQQFFTAILSMEKLSLGLGANVDKVGNLESII